MSREPSALKLLLAFAAVYVIWGSTYLAIHFAIDTLPPFLMAGIRFLVAGGLVYGWARLRGRASRPTSRQWIAAAVVGLLLILAGNGLVVWAEMRIPSGVAALMVASVPCWMVLLDWLRPGGSRPTGQVVAGLLLGLAGLVWLIGPDEMIGGGRVDPLAAGALILSSFSWAAGSIYLRHAEPPSSPALATAMQMLAGGVALTVLSVGFGEPWRFDPAAVSPRSLLALLYLIVFGSIVGFSAYTWLLRVSTPARVSTHAYVNPVVAVLLGWGLAGEAVTLRMAIAAIVILTSVVLITRATRSTVAADSAALKPGALSPRTRGTWPASTPNAPSGRI